MKGEQKMSETKEIKFPFEPNEKVKAAFGQQKVLERVVRIIVEALVSGLTDVFINPWDIVRKEHPELPKPSERYVYNTCDETITLE